MASFFPSSSSTGKYDQLKKAEPTAREEPCQQSFRSWPTGTRAQEVRAVDVDGRQVRVRTAAGTNRGRTTASRRTVSRGVPRAGACLHTGWWADKVAEVTRGMLTVVTDSGHFIQNEDPDLVVWRIRRIWSSRPPGPNPPRTSSYAGPTRSSAASASTFVLAKRSSTEHDSSGWWASSRDPGP